MTDKNKPDEPVEVPAEIVRTPDIITQTQIAHTFGRKIETYTPRITKLATLDQETAEGCFYTLKRKDTKTGAIKLIQGPSIRLAEIAVQCYGNFRWGGRTVREEAGSVVCQGVAHDLENNVHLVVEVARRITTKEGKRYGEDMIAVTTMAGIAICLRNVAFKVIPKHLWGPAYEAAMATAVGDASTLADRRQKMIGKFAKMAVGIERILAYVEKKSVDEIGLEDLQALLGVFTAIRDGEQSIDEAFGRESIPEPKSEAEAATAEGEGAQPDPRAPPADTPKAEGLASEFQVDQSKKILTAHKIPLERIPSGLTDLQARDLINAGSNRKNLDAVLDRIARSPKA